jgi:phosphoglycerate dehydrogenase-like enzyme
VISTPVIVVAGTGADDPPAGIQAAEADVSLHYVADLEGLVATMADADGLLLWGAEREWLQAAWGRAARLRWIHSPSDGVDWFLFPELVDSAVEVTNARGVYEDGIAEWVVGVMLAFATRILHQRDAQLRREWSPRETERLAGTRLLVVGPGPIGRAVAWRAEALGMHVAAAGRTARRDELFGDVISTGDAAALAEALAAADVVLDALPLTSSTAGFFDAARFAQMRPATRFINVGRGGTVDELALIEALADGRIGGAALDVYRTEPLPPDSALWSLPNALVSPHMCGRFEGWQRATVEVFVDNAARFARGEPLRNPVDKRAGHGLSS